MKVVFGYQFLIAAAFLVCMPGTIAEECPENFEEASNPNLQKIVVEGEISIFMEDDSVVDAAVNRLRWMASNRMLTLDVGHIWKLERVPNEICYMLWSLSRLDQAQAAESEHVWVVKSSKVVTYDLVQD